MKSSLGKALLVYLCAALVIGIFLGSINLPRYRLLAEEGKAVLATVDSTDCRNHATFSYSFNVGQHKYSRRGTAGFGTPECENLEPGSKVVAYYLPRDPNTSEPGDIYQRLRNEVISLLIGAIAVPMPLVLGLWWRVHRWRKGNRREAPTDPLLSAER
jgi:hypothetical protein